MAAVALAASGGVLFGQAGGEGWVIERLHVDFDVRPDASIVVREAFDVDFRTLQRHGILRDVVAVQSYDLDDNRRYDIGQPSVTSEDGRIHQVRVERAGAMQRFRIGDPDREISGRQTYRIAYTLNGALNGFPTHDELYWNAVGTWPVRITRASVTLRAPAGGVERVQCFQGLPGSTEPCEATFTVSEATFRATRVLEVGEQLTVVAGLRKGAVAAPSPILYARPRVITQFFDRTSWLLTAFWSGLVVAVVGVGALWWMIGRDRRYVSLHYLSQKKHEERVPLFGKDPVVVEFRPPDKIRPGQIGLLLDERADTLDITATIVDLAVRGYLRITEIPKTGWFGSTDWELDRLKDSDEGLLEYERVVMNGLFGVGPSRKLSALKNHFHEHLAMAKTALYRDAVERRWFRRNPNTVRVVARLAGVAVIVAGVALTLWLGHNWGYGLAGLPVVAFGLLAGVLARAMPRRTAAGREVLRRSLGFARYIRTAEQHQQDYAERAGLFTEYLPYAVAFKAVDRWAKAFKDIDLQAATQGWYAGTSNFDAGQFSSSLGSFESTVSSAMASTPGGSGGSGFSGGSSGGGGGGGGGGSW